MARLPFRTLKCAANGLCSASLVGELLEYLGGETKSCLKEDHKRYWGNFDANVSPDLWVMGNQFVCGLCEIL